MQPCLAGLLSAAPALARDAAPRDEAAESHVGRCRLEYGACSVGERLPQHCCRALARADGLRQSTAVDSRSGLLGANFFAAKSYNPSMSYAPALVYLGDRCSSGGPFVQKLPGSEPGPTLAEVQEIQRRLTAGWDYSPGCVKPRDPVGCGPSTALAKPTRNAP